MSRVMAVDVGTGSARAGLFSSSGELLSRSEAPIELGRPSADMAQQSSEEIWRAVCRAVRDARAEAGVPPEGVAGLSFDATSCTLVVLEADGGPLSVSPDADPRWNVIVWMDHRAVREAELCTATGHAVLDHVGGVMSPEMAVPKLLWLKRHLPESWRRIGMVFDLADFLTWRSTGSLARSACTLVCKWNYLAHRKPGWQEDFLSAVGLPELRRVCALPEHASPVGRDLGPLTPRAAEELGLAPGCRVAAGLIDAHAGALGLLGGLAPGHPERLDRHLALIAGTSTCHMAMSPQPRHIRGVWGPYFGVALPDLWLNEGGQTVTGALLDHLLRWIRAGGEADARGHRRVLERITELRAREGADLAPRLMVLPDFHGNRSPLADPHLLGVISGLALDDSFDALCRLYYRAALAVVLGTRHIIDAMNEKGYAIDTLHLAGGHARNPLLVELYADATGCVLVEPGETDPVLLGTACAAAAGAGLHGSLAEAAAAMRRPGRERRPDAARRDAHERAYRAFLAMYAHRRELDSILAASPSKG